MQQVFPQLVRLFGRPHQPIVNLVMALRFTEELNEWRFPRRKRCDQAALKLTLSVSAIGSFAAVLFRDRFWILNGEKPPAGKRPPPHSGCPLILQNASSAGRVKGGRGGTGKNGLARGAATRSGSGGSPMLREPVFTGAFFDEDGDVVDEGEGGFHDVVDFWGQLGFLVGVEIEDEFIVDLADDPSGTDRAHPSS